VTLAGSGLRVSPRRVPGASAEVYEQDGNLAFQDLRDGSRSAVQCPEANGESYPVARLRDGEGVVASPTCVYQIRGQPLQIIPAKE
jgi:hypothetical protein